MNAGAPETVTRLDKWLWHARFSNPKRRQQGHFGRTFPARWSGDDKTAPPSLMRAGLDFIQGDRVRVIKVLAIGNAAGQRPKRHCCLKICAGSGNAAQGGKNQTA